MAKSTRSPADAVAANAERHHHVAHLGRHDDRTVAFDPLDPPREHVLAAEKFGDVAVLRLVIDVTGRAGLLDLALFHHHHDVGDRDRFKLGVGDVDEGDSEITLHPAELLPHLHPELFVERRQRLVQQQHLRPGDGGARQRDALLLAARKLRRQPVGKFRQPDLLDHGIGRLAPLLRAYAAHAQGESDVVADVQMRKQRVGLEHHRGAPLDRRKADDVLAADQYLAMGRVLVAGDHAQDRRLAAA